MHKIKHNRATGREILEALSVPANSVEFDEVARRLSIFTAASEYLIVRLADNEELIVDIYELKLEDGETVIDERRVVVCDACKVSADELIPGVFLCRNPRTPHAFEIQGYERQVGITGRALDLAVSLRLERQVKSRVLSTTEPSAEHIGRTLEVESGNLAENLLAPVFARTLTRDEARDVIKRALLSAKNEPPVFVTVNQHLDDLTSEGCEALANIAADALVDFVAAKAVPGFARDTEASPGGRHFVPSEPVDEAAFREQLSEPPLSCPCLGWSRDASMLFAGHHKHCREYETELREVLEGLYAALRYERRVYARCDYCLQYEGHSETCGYETRVRELIEHVERLLFGLSLTRRDRGKVVDITRAVIERRRLTAADLKSSSDRLGDGLGTSLIVGVDLAERGRDASTIAERLGDFWISDARVNRIQFEPPSLSELIRLVNLSALEGKIRQSIAEDDESVAKCTREGTLSETDEEHVVELTNEGVDHLARLAQRAVEAAIEEALGVTLSATPSGSYMLGVSSVVFVGVDKASDEGDRTEYALGYTTPDGEIVFTATTDRLPVALSWGKTEGVESVRYESRELTGDEVVRAWRDEARADLDDSGDHWQTGGGFAVPAPGDNPFTIEYDVVVSITHDSTGREQAYRVAVPKLDSIQTGVAMAEGAALAHARKLKCSKHARAGEECGKVSPYSVDPASGTLPQGAIYLDEKESGELLREAASLAVEAQLVPQQKVSTYHVRVEGERPQGTACIVEYEIDAVSSTEAKGIGESRAQLEGVHEPRAVFAGVHGTLYSEKGEGES